MAEIKSCEWKLLTGQRKGQPCGKTPSKPVNGGHYCAAHSKKVDQVPAEPASTVLTCTWVLSTGKNKGQSCGRKVSSNGFCGIHAKKSSTPDAQLEDKGTITVTLGDRAENNVKNQVIGQMAEKGYDNNGLLATQELFETKFGIKTKLFDLTEVLPEVYRSEVQGCAKVLVVRNALSVLLPKVQSEELFLELKGLEWDKKFLHYGKVCDKHARWNLCVDDASQEPNYEIGNGRIIAFKAVPLLREAFDHLISELGGVLASTEVLSSMKAELNYYYKKDCGIGPHGDKERRCVIGIRLGSTSPLVYWWYHRNQRISEAVRIDLAEGDLYIMGDKAVGTDWGCSSKVTLRHAAGGTKYIQ